MLEEELNLNIDFINREYNVGEGFSIVQGGSPYKITISLTTNGVPSSAGRIYELMIVTSDSLDYKKTFKKFKSGVLSSSPSIRLTEEDVGVLSKVKGNCQIVVKLGASYSIPFNFYVIPNPVSLIY